jgi:hypothetical protein
MLYLTNIHRLYEKRSNHFASDAGRDASTLVAAQCDVLVSRQSLELFLLLEHLVQKSSQPPMNRRKRYELDTALF